MIIIFDGVCNLCNDLVAFIIKRDPQSLIKFAPMQSAAAASLLKDYGISDTDLDTFILIKDRKLYERSTAALEIAFALGWPWRAAMVFKIIPRPLRDMIYRIIANNRYRWFGKREQCMVPDDNVRNRFLE